MTDYTKLWKAAEAADSMYPLGGFKEIRERIHRMADEIEKGEQ